MTNQEAMQKKRIYLINQVIKWAAEHDGKPPTAADWKGSRGSGWPSYLNGYRYFGSWDKLITAAGFQARGRGRPAT